MIEHCTHGMPSPASCWECMEEGPVVPPKVKGPKVKQGSRTTARYASRCGNCFEPIGVGDTIAFSETELWVCANCADLP